MNNLQSGFIGRNLRMKEGQVQLRPNEWKVVNASGEDLQKSIYPLPTKEPSAVLMNLLQMLITSGNQLASIAEIMVGKMPGQNTPATTTQETVKQGMAVFTAVYKRVYRSLQEEFKKLFRLNRITPNIIDEEMTIAGIQIAESDYNGTKKLIIPGGDPSGDSASVKQQKLQGVGQMIQLGTINGMEYTKRMLDAYEIQNAEQLIAQPQPPAPDPKMETEKMKQQTMQMKAQMDQQTAQADIANKQELLQLQIAQKQMEMEFKRQMQAIEIHNTKQSKQLDLVLQTIQMQQDAKRGALEVQKENQMADHQMIRADQLHNMEMKHKSAALEQQTKAAAAKPKAKGKAK
jgi:chaperonin GroES